MEKPLTLSRGCIHDNHPGLVMTIDEHAIGLRIIGRAGRSLRHTDGETLLAYKRFRIEDHHNIGTVLALDTDQPIGANHRLFAITLGIHCSYNLAERTFSLMRWTCPRPSAFTSHLSSKYRLISSSLRMPKQSITAMGPPAHLTTSSGFNCK